jgi:Domain of unknown function (DUF4157)/Heterokaryon incompatibility protein Het-C
MEKQQVERQDQNASKMPMSALAGPGPVTSGEQSSEQAAAWAGSPETAAAKESVRRDAASANAPSAAALEAQVNLPSPTAELATAGGGIVGPELLAHVAAEEQKLKGDALTRGYQAVVAGGAAANGQPEAQAAIAAASPEMREAATSMAADKSSGAPLPDDVRAKMETKLGADFSDVQVHVGDDRASTLGAGAATAGTHIYFAPGKYQPGTAEGDKLLAHELTHVVQQRGAQTKGAGGAVVAGSSSHAEQEAEKVGAAVHAGADVAPIAAGTAAADVHLGEAGVHQGIELEAAGVGGKFDPDKLTPQQKAALEMYSGNFMRDYSQLAAPTPLAALSNIPSTHKGGVTGAAGARVLMDAIVQSIAILELGKDIGKSLVTSKNIGVYKAEQHLDNPMGTAGANDFITDGPKPKLAASPDPKCLKTVDARGDEVVTEAGSSDKATASTHGGSSMPGLQYENPDLYQVGEGGLANHLLNSTEHAKDRFLDAAKAGPSPTGRMNMGMGQHVIEDYFSHSNFIEVALNRYINDAVSSRKQHKNAAAGKSPEQAAALNKFYDGFIDKDGKPKAGATTAKAAGGVHAEFSFVDTLYDQKTPDGRQAVTTGTFGGTDTKVSLGHVLLPKLPLLESALHKGIDSTFGVIDKAAKEKKAPTWQTIKGLLAHEGRNGAIAEVMLEACNSVGLAVPCPTGFHLTYKEVGLPLLGSISVPNGIDLDTTNVGVSQALVTGAGTYVAVMEALDNMKKASGYLFLDGVITAIQEKVKQAMTAVGAAVRAKMSEMISQYIREMYNIDAKDAAHASVGELSHMAEEQMHEMEEKTSMQSRLQDGGDLHGLTEQGDNGRKELERRVGPVKAKDESLPKATWGTKANPWVTVNALPPSHSEISKDHPPHAHEDGHPDWHKESKEKEAIRDGVSEGWDKVHDHDHNEEGEEHGHEALNGGSSFYELHRRLAVEADRHVMKQMETIWGASIIPGKKIDEDGMAISHDKMLKSASGTAKDASAASARGGFRHAQSDERVPAELRNRPEVMSLLNLVDYFVSHPTASTWWRSIFDSYIASDSAKVYADILARNKTRGRRQAPGK